MKKENKKNEKRRENIYIPATATISDILMAKAEHGKYSAKKFMKDMFKVEVM